MKLILFTLFFVIESIVFAQYKPDINAALNYTQVPFEWDAIANATEYYIVIKEQNSSLNVFSKRTTLNVILVTDKLQFGKKYEWQITTFNNKKIIHQSNWMGFNINNSNNVLQNKIQFNITTAKKNAFQDDYLFIENLGIAINRKGVPVWFMLKDESIELDEKSYRSMQLTNTGTITFLTASNAYETDLNGNIIWLAPKNAVLNIGGSEEYHHHFAKMPFGTYMCTSYAYFKQAHLYNKNKEVTVRYNTLIEYDKFGNVIWTWNEKDHTDPKVIFENSSGDEAEWAGTHMNGFVYNAIDNSIFLSYRNSSQIQKIDYLTGKLLYTWSGKPSKFNKPPFSFYNQHGPSLTNEGNVIVYNNNIQEKGDKPIYPTIQIIQNPNSNNKGNLLWEYECKWDAKKEGIQSKEGFALELQNKNILVNIGGTERIFEVNKSKEVVWDCNFKKLDKDSIHFIPFSNYRCYSSKTLHPVLFAISITNQKSLPLLKIFNLGNDDSYSIIIMDSTGVTQIYNTKATVKANENYIFNIKKILPKLPIKYIVKVSSNTDANKIKQIAN